MSPAQVAQTPDNSTPERGAPAKPSVVRNVAPRAAVERSKRPWIFMGLTLPLVALNVYGLAYYAASPAARVRHPLHAYLKPSGLVGQSAGIAAFVIFVFLWLYPLRKKWKRLAFTGTIAKWLDVHVTSALLLPLLLATHATWRSDGIIGLGLVAMMVVIASGVVGRYLYTRIPRAKSGVELDRDEVAAARRDLLQRLAATTGQSPEALEAVLSTQQDGGASGIIAALKRMLLNDVTRARRVRELRHRWAGMATGTRSLSGRALDEAVALADREIALDQQVRMLDATHRVFKFWHVAHRPFAVTALVAVTIHIAVVVTLGATWFW